MPTRQAIEREIRGDLIRQGFSVTFLNQWPARVTYYKKDGEPMPGLPADPFSMQNYLARGFTLFPPPTPPEEPPALTEEVPLSVATVAPARKVRKPKKPKTKKKGG